MPIIIQIVKFILKHWKWFILLFNYIKKKTIKIKKIMNKETIGLLTKEQEKVLAEIIDKAIKFKNPLLEAGDKLVFEQLIKLLDDYFLDKKIPEDWDNPLEEILTAIFNEDWELVSDTIMVVIQNQIDISWLDDDIEELIYEATIKFLLALILKAVDKF